MWRFSPQRSPLLYDERYRTPDARNGDIDDRYALVEAVLGERTTGELLEALSAIDVPAVAVASSDKRR